MRRQDWPSILEAEIERARERPFSWGRHDCALWTAGVVAAITGVDYAADWRGKYASEFGAIKRLTASGYEGVEALATACLGDSISPLLAQRGDVAMFDNALGICIGSACAFITREEGLTFVPLGRCVKAWRVQ